MLFNEPKLLKSQVIIDDASDGATRFSALQRAEIAEMAVGEITLGEYHGFSALQRAEIAEIRRHRRERDLPFAFQCSSTSRNC